MQTHDVHLECLESEETFENALESCYYLQRSLVSTNLLRKLKPHGVNLIRINAIKLKTKKANNQKSDLSFNLKKQILSDNNMTWLSTNAFEAAKEFNFDPK